MPGTIRALHLVVADTDSVRAGLFSRGFAVGDVEDVGGLRYAELADGSTLTFQQMA